MKKIFKHAARCFVCVCLTAVMCMNGNISTYATNQSDVDEARKQAEATKDKINELNGELSDISGKMEEVEKYVQELDVQLDALTANIQYYQGLIADKEGEITAKNEEINIKQQEIDAKNTELNQAQKEEKEQYDAMALRIQYMYEQGDASALDAIFSSKDISDLLGRAEYFASITAYDRQQLQVIKETEDRITLLLSELTNDKAELDEEKAELETQKTELVSYKTELEEQEASVITAMAAQEAAMTSLANQQDYIEKRRQEEEANLKAQQEEAARLQALWEEEQRRQAEQGVDADAANKKKLDEIGLNGGFTWPLPGYNHISSRFGNRVLYGVPGFHGGVDISGVSPVTGKAVYGAPIVAAYDGTVEVARYYVYGADYGNCVQINHGAGVVTRYAHMSKIAVSEGQTVKAGDVIGYVGNTGNSFGAHLHLALISKGQLIDPLLYFTVPSY